MHLYRSQKERIATALIVILLIPVVFFGGRAALRALRNRPDPLPVPVERPEQNDLRDAPMVTYLEGTADGRRGASDQWEQLAVGDELDSTSVVRTYSQSNLDLRLQAGSVVRVMEDTLFSISSLGSERIEMDVRQGELVARLARLTGAQELSIRSRGAVAGVRGTELVLAVSQEETIVFGMSGSVEVHNPEFPDEVIRLGVHQKTGLSLGTPPSDPEPMTAGEIDRYRLILNSLNEEQLLLVDDRITFLPDSAELTPGAQEVLREISLQLQAVARRIEIVGHTADIGSEQAQINLSTRRAESVKEDLVELGMPESSLVASGVGGSQPRAGGTDPEALRLNRRVEFRVSDE